MGVLYILQSEKNGRYYIGSTNDLARRLVEHNSGKTKSLKYLRPLKVVFKKIFGSLTEARYNEQVLKKLKSRSALETVIRKQELLGL